MLRRLLTYVVILPPLLRAMIRVSKLALVFAFTLFASLLCSSHARAAQPLPKEGIFGAGIGAVPNAIGTAEVF